MDASTTSNYTLSNTQKGVVALRLLVKTGSNSDDL
jgi:hypothetical protein